MPVKAKVEETGHQGIAIGQGQQAVPDVTRREHTLLLPETPRTAAIVRDGHNGGQALGVCCLSPCRARREQCGLQSSEDDRESRPPAQGHHPEVGPERGRRRVSEEPSALFHPPAVKS